MSQLDLFPIQEPTMLTIPTGSPVDFDVMTSRYQNGPAIVASGLVPVRITRGYPRFRLPYAIAGNLPLLAPSKAEFAITDRARFTKAYMDRLDASADILPTVREMLTMVSESHDGRGLVLLCFEDVTGPDWCHRLVFAEWWEARTGQSVPEL